MHAQAPYLITVSSPGVVSLFQTDQGEMICEMAGLKNNNDGLNSDALKRQRKQGQRIPELRSTICTAVTIETSQPGSLSESTQERKLWKREGAAD